MVFIFLVEPGDLRQKFKMYFLEQFQKYINELKKKF